MKARTRVLARIYNMNKKITALKIRLPKEGFYLIIWKRMYSCKKEGSELIPFPKIFSKLCVSLQITKQQAWEILYFFNDLGLIQIVCGHGIKLIGEIK
jgi:hypothetical protein